MGVVVAASAVWCALSVVFAGAHCRWVHYAPAFAPPPPRVSRLGSFVTDDRDAAPEGADVSEFFRSYHGGGAIVRPSRGVRVPAARS
jgi:hypothetical protein